MIGQGAEMWAQTPDGENFPSKAAIRRALDADWPQDGVVWIELGTVENGFQDKRWTSAALMREIGDAPRTLLVVGPDPYRKRNYYGTVSIKNGKVKVA